MKIFSVEPHNSCQSLNIPSYEKRQVKTNDVFVKDIEIMVIVAMTIG